VNDGIDRIAADAGEKFAELVRIMARLRAPGGCPWDRKQSFDTIKPYLLEETYEVMAAIDGRDWPGLTEELGDLLLQPVFFAEMARDEGLFHIADSLDSINRKLVRRHPHVFADASAETPEDVKQRWDEIKQQEKAGRKEMPVSSVLDEIPRSLPALVEAEKISQKAAGKGFEWPDINGVLDKLREELEELAAARQTAQSAAVEHEVGDLLFTLANVARFLKVDPEQALRRANGRFRTRFAHVEKEIATRGNTFESTSLDAMEQFWQAAKSFEPAYNQEK
jgi:nucleoside triphosphate diphosphatase